MIVEVRSYRVKPGHRAEFIRFFETRAMPALRSHGMRIVGPLPDLENPNKFVWLRGFPSMEALDDRQRSPSSRSATKPSDVSQSATS